MAQEVADGPARTRGHSGRERVGIEVADELGDAPSSFPIDLLRIGLHAVITIRRVSVISRTE